MLDQTEINKLLSELEKVKSEIKELKNNMNSLDRKKEDLFRDKKRISSQIYSKIKNAQDYKEKRNSLTSIVKTTKLSKEELEKRYQELDSEIKKLKDEKKKIFEKIGVDDPIQLKKNIKKLEFRIETEAISFDKEKELMKVLSKMKKQLEKASEVNNIDSALDERFKEFREIRDHLNMNTKIVQHSAKESQKHHLGLIESSKEIDELKAKESSFEQEISKYKANISVLNDDLTKKVDSLNAIKAKLNEHNVHFKEDVEKSQKEILKQKDVEVQEKIKSGKKLTTEDLLILQRTMK